MEVGFDDLLHFPLWFAIDNVRWWSVVIRTVSLGFAVTRQKVDVEDRVDLHGWG